MLLRDTGLMPMPHWRLILKGKSAGDDRQGDVRIDYVPERVRMHLSEGGPLLAAPTPAQPRSA